MLKKLPYLIFLLVSISLFAQEQGINENPSKNGRYQFYIEGSDNNYLLDTQTGALYHCYYSNPAAEWSLIAYPIKN